MANIVNGSAGIAPDSDQLRFVLVGDPNNPNGGLLERFDIPAGSHPWIPSLGITFSGATPVTEYPTAVYTAEYDGFADFPRYPINFLSDLNALMGLLFAHTLYPTYTPTELATAVEVPTSAGYDGATTYYMIPAENLPLLDPVRWIPVIGPLTADLIEPDLRVLVNLGYGDPEYGWVNENADVPTPIGVSSGLDDLEKALGLLVTGTRQGIQNVIDDLQDPSKLRSPDNPIADLLQNPVIAELAAGFFPGLATPGSLSIPDAISAALSDLYSALLPTADINTAITSTLPQYDIDLFFNALAEGNLVDAIGLPTSANLSLVSMAAMFELCVIGETALYVGADILSP